MSRKVNLWRGLREGLAKAPFGSRVAFIFAFLLLIMAVFLMMAILGIIK